MAKSLDGNLVKKAHAQIKYTLEEVQHLLGHADPRTTKIYDHRKKVITRNIVERISIGSYMG